MIDYLINEIYDGRLPQYEVVEVEENRSRVLEVFDTQEQAEEYLQSLL